VTLAFPCRACALVALASTITREFQVWKNGRWEVAGAKGVAVEKVFQVRFKLFQVRVGSALSVGGYGPAEEKPARNGWKWWENQLD